MARVDVSELMVDPDFVMNFTIIRRTATINEFGENQPVETSEPGIGSIQAPTKETASRLPEGVQLTRFKTVFTKAVFYANAAGKYVDQIEYKGKRYNVAAVTPWEDFGAGWFMVDVELENKSL